MQLMSDAVTVLGSRHGLFWAPCQRETFIVRSGFFPGIPCRIRAGITVNGRTLLLPLTPEGERFAFCDQDTSPCAMKLTGIDPATCLKAELAVRIPFRPRDAAFSTTPVIDLELSLSQLADRFRWVGQQAIEGAGEMFLEIASDAFTRTAGTEDAIEWEFEAASYLNRRTDQPAWTTPQRDRLVVHAGAVQGTRIVVPFTASDFAGKRIHASWCTWSEPLLEVHGRRAPFKYTESFGNLEDVCRWAKDNPRALIENAARVDGIFGAGNLSASTNRLLANTLHAWLACTWWALDSGREWFTVWEGSCYYHSTIDVEYTQTPFYMSVWPELLGLELDEWPEFTVPGETVIGERGAGAVVFMHDFGQMSNVHTTMYNHHMPVEENTNYVLMSYAYWKRTGDDSRIRRHAGSIAKALAFVMACDTTGNGVPNLGMANTIDDASPAVQFGKEQIYLAVKAQAAFEVGAEMLDRVGAGGDTARLRETAARIAATIRDKGWAGDHFVTLLDKSAEGVKDSWSGKTYSGDVLPGWDAAHIYTANGIALLDMIGRRIDLDEDRLRMDLRVATERCLDKYGCRHSDYTPDRVETTVGEGGAARNTSKRGWISMNMLRDISALYRGIDLRALADRYWEFQVLTNTQGPHLFFETFNGNNLMCYPRGVAVYGIFEAVGGVRIDKAEGRISATPYDDQVRVPLLLEADWRAGVAPMIENGALREKRI